MLKKTTFRNFYFIISIYLLGILAFSLFRIIFLLFNFEQTATIPDKAVLIAKALFMGFRFDTVISMYILAPPALLLFIFQIIRKNFVFVNKVLLTYILTLYLISFIICSADIPFFKQFFSRFSVVAFNWFDSPGFVFKMIFQEIRYFAFSIVFIVFAVFFVLVVIKLYRRFLVKMKFDKEISVAKYFSVNISLTILLLLLALLGARGRIAEKSPIQIGTSYFSDYAFINQMGLNPVFTFMRSYLDSKDPEKQVVKLMDDKKAIDYVRKQFNLGSFDNSTSPILRFVNPSEKQIKANVVVVIMESISAELMQRYGNKNRLTPFLDSLANNSYCFDSIYTAGIHTMNGIYSTLFSFPALFRQHTMNVVDIPEYTGFSKTLKNNGYRTCYFTNHDEQFDNAGGFLKANSFDEIISQKDYPSEEVLSTLGVPDHYLFEYSIKYLSERHKEKRPFFAAFMTSSNHGPYIIPENIDFKPQSKEVIYQTVEYSDWSLRHFLKLASKEKWFDSTIFVFISDHGQVVGESKYDMPLTYHHTPLIIYSKLFAENKVFTDIGGQIDVFPTVMGLLNINYSNNTMGIDLVNDKRKYIYFSSDDLVGCLDNKYFYIYRLIGSESLYMYRKNDPYNYINDFRTIADSMKSYTFSMLQTTQWMILNKKTGDSRNTMKIVN